MRSRGGAWLIGCFALLLAATPDASAILLVEYTSNFADGNLNAPLGEAGPGSSVTEFTLLSGGGNTVPLGDSVTFRRVGTGTGVGFFRGTSSPASVPGFVTMVDRRFISSGASAAEIEFSTTAPISQIRLTVADLELSDANLTFSSAGTAGVPTSVTSFLDLSGGTVTTTNGTNGVQGEIIWDFVTPISDPTISFDYTDSGFFGGDQTHFTNLAYIVAVPEPTAALFGSLVAGALGLTVARRRPIED